MKKNIIYINPQDQRLKDMKPPYEQENLLNDDFTLKKSAMIKDYNPGRDLQAMRPKKKKKCIVCGEVVLGIYYKDKPCLCHKDTCSEKYYYRQSRLSQGKSYNPRIPWACDISKS